MTSSLHMPLADSQLNGGGLLPAANTRESRTAKRRPDSNLGLPGPISSGRAIIGLKGGAS